MHDAEHISCQVLPGVFAVSAQMHHIARVLYKVAPSNASLLLLGESGTGKECLARASHYLSARKPHPFVAINCAAIPENLLESELFGFERGAFTGATKQTPGRIELANKGTLFLDEIGDLPFSLQAKLLRFLQEREIEHLGGRKSISVDVRVVCATHADLEAKMKRGAFREDLFYRLAEISIKIPALRERPGDAVLIATRFLQRLDAKGRYKLSEEAKAAIETYPWPGNVRELENRLKRATIVGENNILQPKDLELDGADLQPFPSLKSVRVEAEAALVARALALSNGQLTAAAALLQITRPTLYDLLVRLGFRKKIKSEEEVLL